MSKLLITVTLTLLIGSACSSTFSFFQPLHFFSNPTKSRVAQERVLFDLDPEDVMTKWGPFGYFNQYFDPANTIGPEILRGFGSPFTPYNGFQLLETITTPPLKVPEEATTTPSPYPAGLFDQPAAKPKAPAIAAPSPPPAPVAEQAVYAQNTAPPQPPPSLPMMPQRPYPAQYGRPMYGPNSFEDAYGAYQMSYGQPHGGGYPGYYGPQVHRSSPYYRPNYY